MGSVPSFFAKHSSRQYSVLMFPVTMEDEFSHYAEGRVVPPVDSEAIKRRRNLKPLYTSEEMHTACGSGADIPAIIIRDGMIEMLTHLKLLTPWQHGGKLDDAVFRVAAIFPMRVFSHRVYKLAGDDILPFDPNAFVQQLIEETGISHIWEPVPTKIAEGGFSYSKVSVTFKGQGPPDPESEAKHEARDLLWDVWSRYNNFNQILPDNKDTVAIMFADFVIDNIDLARELTSRSSDREGADPVAILTELERRAQGWKP